MNWAVDSWLIFRKDIHQEFRTRYAVNAIALFALTTLTVISFSFGPVQLRSVLAAPVLWVLLFFSAISGLSHIFVREEEQGTSDTLRLMASPSAVFLGKWLFNIVLLLAIEGLIVPLYFVFMNVPSENTGLLLFFVLLGSFGLATVSTLIAAIIAQASSRGALFAVLAFPIALPVLISAVHGTRLAMDGNSFSDCLPDVQVLTSFTVVIFTTGLLVFEKIWRSG